ncbi:MAG: ATP-binding protein [Thermoproteota archaeon]|nr:ATP-binding protein [Thermoproteota archaeon]
MFRRISSRISAKIGILVGIQIVFVISNIAILAYFESQGALLGNSVNIAGKNRFLTYNVLVQTLKYLSGFSSVSAVNIAMSNFESNLLVLREGGNASPTIELNPLPSQYLDLWKATDTNWQKYKKYIIDNIIKPSQTGAQQPPTSNLNLITELQSLALSLISSSDTLVTALGNGVKTNAHNLTILEIALGILNIAILMSILYLIIRILRPIFSLTRATAEVKKGNLNVSVNRKGNDELTTLSESFNSMVYSIKDHIENQNVLTGKLENANEELIVADKAKTEFVSMISHELKTPLVPMKLYCQMFMKKSLGSNLNEKQKKAIQIIDRNLERLEMLVTDILDCYKLDIGKITLFREDANIDTIIRTTITDLKSIIEDQQIFLKLDLRTTGTIFCDPKRIEQVLSNLLKNSFDFVPENNGKITMRVEDYKESKITSQNEASSEFVMFTVDDNGPGITQDEIDKLFKKFYQIDTSFRRKHGGTGLGLSICRGLVEAHGGKMWYDKNYNVGASFKFTIPRFR